MAPKLIGPAWILAGEQTAGRGRRARSWASPRGNFHGTYVMKPTERLDVIALRSFAASLALREAFIAVTGLPNAFALKWPNDVLLNGGKIAGILLESAGSGKGISYLAIGMGVNVCAALRAKAAWESFQDCRCAVLVRGSRRWVGSSTLSLLRA